MAASGSNSDRLVQKFWGLLLNYVGEQGATYGLLGQIELLPPANSQKLGLS